MVFIGPKRRRQIEKLARDSATSPEWVFDMVLAFGIEMAAEQLEAQINLVASVKQGPEGEEEPPVAAAEQPPIATVTLPPLPSHEPIEEPIDLGAILEKKREELGKETVHVNGDQPQNSGPVDEGSDNVGERREEQPEGAKNDFVDALTD